MGYGQNVPSCDPLNVGFVYYLDGMCKLILTTIYQIIK